MTEHSDSNLFDFEIKITVALWLSNRKCLQMIAFEL